MIKLSYPEMLDMCGNMIMLRNSDGQHCVVMSKRALKNLAPETEKILKDNYRIIAADIPTIEHIGGGSARCMIAELF